MPCAPASQPVLSGISPCSPAELSLPQNEGHLQSLRAAVLWVNKRDNSPWAGSAGSLLEQRLCLGGLWLVEGQPFLVIDIFLLPFWINMLCSR